MKVIIQSLVHIVTYQYTMPYFYIFLHYSCNAEMKLCIFTFTLYHTCLHTVYVEVDVTLLNSTQFYMKFCKHTYTQPIQMVTSQHIPYLGNNLRVHLCGSIKAPDKIQVVIITNVLVVEGDIFYLWDQIGYVCWVR